MSDPILQVRGLVKNFNVRSTRGLRAVNRTVQAVSDVSFDVGTGAIFLKLYTTIVAHAHLVARLQLRLAQDALNPP